MQKLRSFFVLSLLVCFCLSVTPTLASNSGTPEVSVYQPVEIETKSVSQTVSDVVDTEKTQLAPMTVAPVVVGHTPEKEASGAACGLGGCGVATCGGGEDKCCSVKEYEEGKLVSETTYYTDKGD